MDVGLLAFLDNWVNILRTASPGELDKYLPGKNPTGFPDALKTLSITKERVIVLFITIKKNMKLLRTGLTFFLETTSNHV